MTEPDSPIATGHHATVTFESVAIEARQRHIINLLTGVRALAVAIVVLFFVFGVLGFALYRSTTDTRTDMRRLAREQHIALCDFYSLLERHPPPELRCP